MYEALRDLMKERTGILREPVWGLASHRIFWH